MDLDLSVVVPIYNEQDVLPLFVERLRPVLEGVGGAYEVVAVDDGSSDQTAALLQRFHREWAELRIVRLRANAGHQAAITAGLVAARGDHVVTIDADLQDPPEVIAEMVATVRERQVDVVYGVRTDRSADSAFKRLTAKAFYRLMRTLSDVDAPHDAGDFRLMSRATVDAVNALPEANRVLRLAVPTLGFPSAQVGYRRDSRAAGQSKYPVTKMMKLTIDSLTGFSQAPLRLATWFGLLGFLIAVAMFVYAIIERVVGNVVHGWTSTIVIVSGFAAIQLLCIGVLGEYVGRIYNAQQARPVFYIAYDSLHQDTPSPDAPPENRSHPAPRPQAHPLPDTPRPDARRQDSQRT